VNRLISRTVPWMFLLCVACGQPPGGSGGFRIAYVPSISGQSGIYAMNSDTTGSRRLIGDKNAQLRFTSWSPDGKRIAFFTVRAQDADILSKYLMPYKYLLYVMDSSGNDVKRLLDFPIFDFAWAPNGRQLFVISAHEGPDRDSAEVTSGIQNPTASIYIVDLQTGATTRLPGSGRNCSAAWSPDGARLAVSYGDAENGGLYLIGADGRESIRLTDASTIDCRPKWSPDGKLLAYAAYTKTDTAAGDAGVFVIAADGTGKRRVAEDAVFYMQWSPDSKMLLLQLESSVRLTDLEGKKQVLLSARLRRAMNGQITPDGKGVLFCSNDEGAWNIYSVGLDGEQRKKITGRTNSSNYCMSPLLTSR
jgi:Tol biopolymer transport system component